MKQNNNKTAIILISVIVIIIIGAVLGYMAMKPHQTMSTNKTTANQVQNQTSVEHNVTVNNSNQPNTTVNNSTQPVNTQKEIKPIRVESGWLYKYINNSFGYAATTVAVDNHGVEVFGRITKNWKNATMFRLTLDANGRPINKKVYRMGGYYVLPSSYIQYYNGQMVVLNLIKIGNIYIFKTGAGYLTYPNGITRWVKEYTNGKAITYPTYPIGIKNPLDGNGIIVGSDVIGNVYVFEIDRSGQVRWSKKINVPDIIPNMSSNYTTTRISSLHVYNNQLIISGYSYKEKTKKVSFIISLDLNSLNINYFKVLSYKDGGIQIISAIPYKNSIMVNGGLESKTKTSAFIGELPLSNTSKVNITTISFTEPINVKYSAVLQNNIMLESEFQGTNTTKEGVVSINLNTHKVNWANVYNYTSDSIPELATGISCTNNTCLVLGTIEKKPVDKGFVVMSIGSDGQVNNKSIQIKSLKPTVSTDSIEIKTLKPAVESSNIEGSPLLS